MPGGRTFGVYYSPSPEYPVACYRDEWRGEPRRSSKSEGGLASAQFRFDTPQLAAGSFIFLKNGLKINEA
jgi:hypothetical protein